MPLSLIDELESALASGSYAHREVMLVRVTDLFLEGASRYSEDQVTLFDDVIGRLAAAIETRARAKLANRLAPVSNAPKTVVRKLAFDDDIEVARPILTSSERLDESDLIASALHKSQQHLAAIAERKALSEAVTDVLVQRGNRQVVHSVARNAGARFSDASFRLLVRRSTDDDTLAMHVGARRDLPRHHFLRLLQVASATARARLAAEHPDAGGALECVLGEIVGGIRSEARKGSRDYAAARRMVEGLQQSGRLGEDDVYSFARQRKFEETAVALSLLCGVDNDVVERALLDPADEMALILCRLAGFSSTTAKAILLLRAADGGLSAHALDRALTSYERLHTDTARRVLEFYHLRARTAPVAAAG